MAFFLHAFNIRCSTGTKYLAMFCLFNQLIYNHALNGNVSGCKSKCHSEKLCAVCFHNYDSSLKFGNPPPPFTSNKKMYIPAATCTQIEVLLQNLL